MSLINPPRVILLYQASFGIPSAPTIFQKMIDKVLQGLEGVLCYTYDILVNSEDEASHFQLLGKGFTRLEQHGFHLKQEKCKFLLPVVEYLGHQISSDGVLPLLNKVDPIVKAPIPQNI